MKPPAAPLAALALLACLAPPAFSEEVEHPAYKSWARHPIGTAVAVRSVSVNPRSRLTTTTTYKLLALKPDAAVLETRRVSDATGKVVEGLPDKYEQRRMFPLLDGVKREQIGTPTGAIDKGEETLTLAGRDFKTRWYDTRSRGDAGETFTRLWMSDDVPGRLVKSVTKIPRADTTVTLELVGFKTP